MSDWLCLPAPAKINLMLNITGRRDDGYHLLQTIFRFVDFGDVLRFRLLDEDRVVRTGGDATIDAEDDLVIRAARMLRQYIPEGRTAGIDIQLEKNIPLGAGLGGGSSDAATTLHAVNRLWRCGLSVDELAQVGLQLGADVPVFVHGQSAFAEGIGEVLTPIRLPAASYLMLTPQVHVSTAEIFATSELTRDCPALKICDLLRAVEAEDMGENRGDDWINVCTPVVTKRYPQVAEALDMLSQVGKARMSGTGATVFVEFETDAAARKAAELIEKVIPEGWQLIVARGVDSSPVLQYSA